MFQTASVSNLSTFSELLKRLKSAMKCCINVEDIFKHTCYFGWKEKKEKLEKQESFVRILCSSAVFKTSKSTQCTQTNG